MAEQRTRHVWVKRTFDPTEHVGLVLEWRQTEKGWEALVTYVVDSESRALTTWVPSHDLRPVFPLRTEAAGTGSPTTASARTTNGGQVSPVKGTGRVRLQFTSDADGQGTAVSL